jgi:hypothetical protein
LRGECRFERDEAWRGAIVLECEEEVGVEDCILVEPVVDLADLVGTTGGMKIDES